MKQSQAVRWHHKFKLRVRLNLPNLQHSDLFPRLQMRLLNSLILWKIRSKTNLVTSLTQSKLDNEFFYCLLKWQLILAIRYFIMAYHIEWLTSRCLVGQLAVWCSSAFGKECLTAWLFGRGTCALPLVLTVLGGSIRAVLETHPVYRLFQSESSYLSSYLLNYGPFWLTVSSCWPRQIYHGMGRPPNRWIDDIESGNRQR